MLMSRMIVRYLREQLAEEDPVFHLHSFLDFPHLFRQHAEQFCLSQQHQIQSGNTGVCAHGNDGEPL